MIGIEGGLGGSIFLGLLALYFWVMKLETNKMMKKNATVVVNQRYSSMTKLN